MEVISDIGKTVWVWIGVCVLLGGGCLTAVKIRENGWSGIPAGKSNFQGSYSIEGSRKS